MTRFRVTTMMQRNQSAHTACSAGILVKIALVFLPGGAEGHFVCACAYKICSARLASIWNFQCPCVGFQLGDRHLFVIFFWRGMKAYDKFTIISNSVDTRGVCWLFGWGYFNDQSANKTRKKAENLKFEIWFTNDQDVHMRLQTLKVSL